MPPHRTNSDRYAVFVSGRGSNLKAILDAVRQGRLSRKPALVLSDNENAAALDYAREEGVETCWVDPKTHKGRKLFCRKVMEELKARDIDFICLAGFMRILHEELVREYRGRIVNIHPSLLPDFPGLDVQKRALEAGAKESGCTVHFVDEGVDTGPIIAQARVPVLPADSVESLSERILAQEHRLYPQVVQGLLDGAVRMESGKRVAENND